MDHRYPFAVLAVLTVSCAQQVPPAVPVAQIPVISNQPSQVMLRMSASTPPGNTGQCYVGEKSRLMFSFTKPASMSTRCSATCRFQAMDDSVQVAHTPIDMANGARGTLEFAMGADGLKTESALKPLSAEGQCDGVY